MLFCIWFNSWSIKKIQKMSYRVDSEDPFWKVYCPDQYKTQKMCDKAVDYSLEALNLIPNWFVASKMIK